ncbi:MAG: hypothetical protein E7287_03450 [Lachnospiraceae bacterium]|nr:hypothetical protein [Lachnospiraceae bacterium]
MHKTRISKEYNIVVNNKMMIRTPHKVSSMKNNCNNSNTECTSKMNVELQFPETSEDSDYIINEVRLILLDIFQSNMKEQFSSSAPHSNTKEISYETN